MGPHLDDLTPVATSRRFHRVEFNGHRQSGSRLRVGAISKLPELTFHAASMPLPGRLELALVLEALGFLISIDPTPVAPQDGTTEHLPVLVLRWSRSIVVRISLDILPPRNRAPATRSAYQ